MFNVTLKTVEVVRSAYCDSLSDEDFGDLDGDGIGDECDPDADGDTFINIDDGGDDCNDADATINPGAVEIIGDGIDNDCDGEIDECDDGTNSYFVDADGDDLVVVDTIATFLNGIGIDSCITARSVVIGIHATIN